MRGVAAYEAVGVAVCLMIIGGAVIATSAGGQIRQSIPASGPLCVRSVGTSRADADHNPGALRPRRADPWPGQVAVDVAPGGPFAVFASDEAGWLALDLWLLDAYHVHGLLSVEQIVHRFAPPRENATVSYITEIAAVMHVAPNVPIAVDDAAVRFALAAAISRREGWHQSIAGRAVLMPKEPVE